MSRLVRHDREPPRGVAREPGAAPGSDCPDGASLPPRGRQHVRSTPVGVLLTTTVAPNAGLIAWTGLVALVVVAGIVTAAKGRAGWVAIGLLTGGLAWLVTAFLPALPGSLWQRTIGRRPADRPAGSPQQG